MTRNVSRRPPGYGIELDEDGQWRVARGWLKIGERDYPDRLPHRYVSKHGAYRAAWSDYHAHGDKQGSYYQVIRKPSGEWAEWDGTRWVSREE